MFLPSNSNFREMFRYKGKHILYNTGVVEEVVEEEEEKEEKEGKVDLKKKNEDNDGALSSEQMDVVLNSMSDNRITDSVKSMVDQATEDGALTDEQKNIVLGSMSDNRITDSVKNLVEQTAL